MINPRLRNTDIIKNAIIKDVAKLGSYMLGSYANLREYCRGCDQPWGDEHIPGCPVEAAEKIVKDS